MSVCSISVCVGTDRETGEPTYKQLPGKYEICPVCQGKGTSCAYLGAYTQDEMDELGRDFQDDYASGFYDRTCERCKGERVILVVDRKAARADKRLASVLVAHDREQREERDFQRLCRMERESGC